MLAALFKRAFDLLDWASTTSNFGAWLAYICNKGHHSKCVMVAKGILVVPGSVHWWCSSSQHVPRVCSMEADGSLHACEGATALGCTPRSLLERVSQYHKLYIASHRHKMLDAWRSTAASGTHSMHPATQD